MIPTIQKRRDEGFSSSSRSFIFIRMSRTEGEIIAILRATITLLKRTKMVIETGFCVMSFTDSSMTLVIEENIMY